MQIIGVPVAWLISDREDSVTLDCFLKAVKLKSPSTTINTALTDDGIVHYYNYIISALQIIR